MDDVRCDCGIDPDALDVEWLEQPNTFLYFAETMADARLEMDHAKEEMDLVKAKVDTEIRQGHSTASAHGKRERLTETQVSNLVIQSKKYRDSVDLYLTAKHNFEVISARVKALEQRKTALENLVRLNGQSYFAGPIEPRNLGVEHAKRKHKDKSIARARIMNRLQRSQSGPFGIDTITTE